MKHLVIAAALLLAGLTWVVFGRGGGASDPLAARDALLAGDVVYEFEPANEGFGIPYRLTVLDDGRWLYEPSLSPGGYYAVFDGQSVVSHRSETCILNPRDDVPWPPYPVPGFNYGRTILNGIELTSDGDTYSYGAEVAVGDSRDHFRVTEDLSEIESGEIRTTAQRSGSQHPADGTFRIRALGSDEAEQVAHTIQGTQPNQRFAHVRIAARSLQFTGNARGPYDLLIAPPPCQPGADRPLIENYRGFAFELGNGPVFENVRPLNVALDAPEEEVLELIDSTSAVDTPVATGLVFAAHFESETEDGFILYEVLICEETDWFSCAPAEGDSP